MSRLAFLLAVVLPVLLSSAARAAEPVAEPVAVPAAEPLVGVDWLKSRLGKPGIVVLDLQPSMRDYVAGHIPGAIYTDYARGGWREKNAAGVPGMLPEPGKLASLIGRLGIGNDTHVVLAPLGRNAADMGTATRVYWTFKVLGHDAVSILDGGTLAWAAQTKSANTAIYNMETLPNTRPPATFVAKVRGGMLVDKAGVQRAMSDKTPLVDNRPQDFFMGLTRSPASRIGGTLPGARSLPESWLTRNNGGHFRSRQQLASIYEAAGVPTAGDQISFCNTGHWASLGWFVSSEILGNKSARMYDGSMAEWTADKSLPVDVKIKTP